MTRDERYKAPHRNRMLRHSRKAARLLREISEGLFALRNELIPAEHIQDPLRRHDYQSDIRGDINRDLTEAAWRLDNIYKALAKANPGHPLVREETEDNDRW